MIIMKYFQYGVKNVAHMSSKVKVLLENLQLKQTNGFYNLRIAPDKEIGGRRSVKKGNFDSMPVEIQNIDFAYNRGFRFGYLTAKLGVNWPDIPEEERKSYEDEAQEMLKLWKENCEKGRRSK